MTTELDDQRVLPAAAVTLAGAAAVAAVVAADPGGWYPFGTAKFTAVPVLVLAATAVALWAGVRPALPRPVTWLWADLLVWLAIAAALGRDPLYAWIGTPERRLGWLAWLLFAVCCALGSTFSVADVARWRRWMVAAAVWCGGYALVEAWWRQPIETSALTDRLGGPFGSAAYLGAAVCLLIPTSVTLAVDSREAPVWRIAAVFATLTCSVALVGSGARAAWVGLGVAAIVALVRFRPSLRQLGVAAAVAAAIVGLAMLAVIDRVDDVADRSTSATSRIDEWRLAGRAILEQPVLGAGPEGYRTIVADGMTLEYERTYGREVMPDRAHSGPFDLAAVGGIPAAVFYMLLLGFVVAAAVQRMGHDLPYSGLAIGVVAYIAQQMLLFPLAELDPVFWLSAGMLLAGGAVSSRPSVSGRVAAVTAGAVATAVFVAGAVGLAADRAARRATGRPPAEALVHARRAAELRPDIIRYDLLVAAAATATGTLAGIDEAIEAAERAVDTSPHDPIARRTLAQARLDRARVTGDDADTAAAVSAWRSLVADDPHCQQCHFGLGMAAALGGDSRLAAASLERADALSRPGDTRAADALEELERIEQAAP